MAVLTYFAYGSNMSSVRLQQRVPSARRLGTYILEGHSLQFHKIGHDNSAKCDAHFSNNSCLVFGVLYEFNLDEKPILDHAEGLGNGYEEKTVIVKSEQGDAVEAHTYYATHIDEHIKPFDWYLNHVLIGAREARLPDYYIHRIAQVPTIKDQDKQRDAQERGIYKM